MPRNVRTPLFAALACAIAIAPLAALAYSTGPVQRLDFRVLDHLTHETGTLHRVAEALVNFGDLAALLIMLAAVCAIGLRLGRRRQVVAAVVVVAGANVTTQLLKVILEHARYRAFQHGFELPWASSFPSGHTTAAASITAALLLVVPAAYRLRALALGSVLTAVVGLSTIVLRWHYPSDVLGGLLVVGTWGFAAVAYLRLRRDRERAPSTAEERRPPHLAVSTD